MFLGQADVTQQITRSKSTVMTSALIHFHCNSHLIWSESSSATMFGLNTHGRNFSLCHTPIKTLWSITRETEPVSNVKDTGRNWTQCYVVIQCKSLLSFGYARCIMGLTSPEPGKQILAHLKESHLESNCLWATAHLVCLCICYNLLMTGLQQQLLPTSQSKGEPQRWGDVITLRLKAEKTLCDQNHCTHL